MAEVELREDAIFENMNEDQIQQAIALMAQLDRIRSGLEDDVRMASGETEHIYIKFSGLLKKN